MFGDTMKEIRFAFENYTTAEEIKRIRKRLNLTQKEFAILAGCSKPTVERWETSTGKITGPIAALLYMLERHPEDAEYLKIEEKTLPLRIWYMYRNRVCTIIDADELKRIVRIRNYTDNPMFCAFGTNQNPDFDEYTEFLKSRCFPETRDKMKLVLKDLGIPFYDPVLIIEKTEGRMAEDDFYLRIER